MASGLGVSALVVWDFDSFVRMEAFWDSELRNFVYDPFLSVA